jgi:hypothetical protein
VTLVALVVLTQIVTAIGVGAWFPHAAPALWMGLGGAPAASQVSIIQLLLPLPIAAIAVLDAHLVAARRGALNTARVDARGARSWRASPCVRLCGRVT